MSYYLKAIHELKKEGVEIDHTLRGVRPKLSIANISNSQGSSKVWLISFTDILALMLTFFVMLFAMSEPEILPIISSDAISSPRLEQNQKLGATEYQGQVDSINLNRVGFNRALDLGYLKNIIVEHQKNFQSLHSMQIVEDKDNGRLVLILPETLLFSSGQYGMSEQGKIAVRDLTPILNNIKNGVEIIGHSDPKAPKASSASGGSNMILSLNRAAEIAGGLKKNGYTRDIPYQGYGSALFGNLPEAWSDEQKLQTARRVDIVIYDHDGSRQKRFGIGMP
jgi:chemotaxis protein MotB